MRSRGSRTPLFGLVAAFVLAAPSFGAWAIAVELRGDPGGAATADVVVTRSEVEIPLRLDNDSLESAELTLVARSVRIFGAKACAEGSGCTIGLYLLDSRGEQKLNPGEERKVQLPPLGSQALVVKGRVPGTGRYVLDLVIGDKGGVTVKAIAFRRDLRELPQATLKFGPVGQLPMAYDGSTSAIPIRLAATTDGVHLDRLALSLLKADASGSFTRPVDWPDPDLRCPPDAQPTSGVGKDVAPGATLSCAVHLPQWTWPGVYRIRAEALGSDIKTQEAEADVRVRSPWWFAFISLFGGGLVGGWIASWSRDGRERLLLAIQAQEVREQYIDFEVNVGSGAHFTRDLIFERKEQLARIVDDFRTGRVPLTLTDKVERLRDLLPLVSRLYNLERQFDHPPASGALYAQAIEELRKDDPDLSTCRTRLEALEKALSTAAATQRGTAAADSGAPLFFFSWARGLSTNALRRLLSRNDHVLAFVSVLVAVLIGMVALWSNNSTWGSLGDWLVAFLTGVGVTVGGSVSLQQIAQNYQLGSIARRP